MKVKTTLFALSATTALLLNGGSTFSQVRLPSLVSDGMVLQRNAPVNIWGWASPKEKVTVQFRNKVYEAIANADGKWKVVLSPMKEGGPYTMKIDASNHIELKDILAGDVWLCSGQSNMELPMERVKEKYPEEIKASTNPSIRQFRLPTRYSFIKKEEDVPAAKWEAANPTTVLQFSATGYFFAKSLYDRYKVPIGIIRAAVGGTPAEAWISEEALQAFPDYLSVARRFKDSLYTDSVRKAGSAIYARWNESVQQRDSGLVSPVRWYDTVYAPVGWSSMNIPGYWDDQGLKSTNGVVWFRKEIIVPASMTGKAAKLYMGRIIDADYVYVNGVLVGNITYQYPPRRYEVPPTVLKPGKNIITIRVINSSGKGGFVPDKPYYLEAGGETLPLTGAWKYKLGVKSDPIKDGGINVQYQPTGMFNAMIAPLVNYTIKGAAWYQGESNISRPGNYSRLMTTLIQDWRKQWGQGSFPFLLVQLPNYGEATSQPMESSWALLREQQAQTLSVPHTAMAVTIDLGEWNDIHPLNKKDVGSRLALAARGLAYGEKITYSGPMYQSTKREGNKVILSFAHTGRGLVAKGSKDLRQFTIAGPDKQFVPAKAQVMGNKVVVWSNAVTQPVAVRYAWADNPEGANLYNAEGLPAAPFRTDTTTNNSNSSNAKGLWKNKPSAVVLTYDDALNVHLDHAIPALDSLGLKGTFYLSAYSRAVDARIPEWRKAAANGHELGNHTLYHPCAGGSPGRSFVQPDNDLRFYSVNRMVNEIRMTNTVLKAIDGKEQRTFAYPCGDMKIGDTAYINSMRKEFTGARGVWSVMHPVNNIDLYNIGSYMINGQSGEELIALAKQAIAEKKLIVFLFHGVGGEHSLNVSLEAHSKLLKFLKDNEKDIWVAPMTEVAIYVQANNEMK